MLNPHRLIKHHLHRLHHQAHFRAINGAFSQREKERRNDAPLRHASRSLSQFILRYGMIGGRPVALHRLRNASLPPLHRR